MAVAMMTAVTMTMTMVARRGHGRHGHHARQPRLATWRQH